MEIVIHLTPEQQQHHQRLILGIGDAYDFIAKRLKELDDLTTFEELDARFAAAPNIYEQADVVQEFRRRIGV